MTEFLADGPDWHLRSWFCSGIFNFLRCRHVKRLLDWRIPLIQFLKIRSWWRCRWICKNVSRKTMCVPNAWWSFSAARRYERMPQQSFRYRMMWEWHWSTGNVGISTANWFSILEVLTIVHTIYFILWMNEAAPRSMNSIDAILEDKVLMMTHLDLRQLRSPLEPSFLSTSER